MRTLSGAGDDHVVSSSLRWTVTAVSTAPGTVGNAMQNPSPVVAEDLAAVRSVRCFENAAASWPGEVGRHRC